MHDTTKSKGSKKHFEPIFSDTTSFYNYKTRYSLSNNLYIKKSCLLVQKRAFSRVGAKICNEIPASLREFPRPEKKNTHTHTSKRNSALSFFLKNHDDYIDISQITSTLK